MTPVYINQRPVKKNVSKQNYKERIFIEVSSTESKTKETVKCGFFNSYVSLFKAS